MHIVNLSIEQNVVPNAQVVSLYKKNNSCDGGYYRPVSVLSVVSKILEWSVYTN